MTRILGVGEATRLVRDLVRGEPRLRDLWVEGEVGQLTVSTAGHAYLTLRDERTQLRCVIFREQRQALALQPRTGLRIVAHGRLDVFEAQGAYQLYIDSIAPAGFGDLALRFEVLKARLAAEGLFEADRKRTLPRWPGTIVLCTSLSGAVLHDVIRVLARRWPLVQLVVSPCLVSGEGAAASVVSALRRAGEWRDPRTGRAADLVILARGGGSLEDLWTFNEEVVVRAVAATPLPIIVGVGHETDVTLAEFAADVRAATPSVAAELAVPDRTEQLAALTGWSVRLARACRAILGDATTRLRGEQRALDAVRPAAYLAAERERLGLLLDRASRACVGALAADRARLARAEARAPFLLERRLARARSEIRSTGRALHALSPFATLERGYAIVRGEGGQVLVAANTVAPGDRVDVRLARGALDARVEGVRDSAA